MNWKERFKKEWPLYENMSDKAIPERSNILAFIETEIIAKLIEDIPDISPLANTIFKDQLRTKWLPKE